MVDLLLIEADFKPSWYRPSPVFPFSTHFFSLSFLRIFFQSLQTISTLKSRLALGHLCSFHYDFFTPPCSQTRRDSLATFCHSTLVLYLSFFFSLASSDPLFFFYLSRQSSRRLPPKTSPFSPKLSPSLLPCIVTPPPSHLTTSQFHEWLFFQVGVTFPEEALVVQLFSSPPELTFPFA